MNSIVTAKYISERVPYAGRKWFYQFRQLDPYFGEPSCTSVASGMASRYSRLTKSWEKYRNSEWICRIYLSAKMILAASVQLASRQYAYDRNLRTVEPYLAYYAILTLMRAIVFTLPDQEWNDGGIIELKHDRIITLAVEHITKFDAEVASRIKYTTLYLKAARELISYRHPSSGDQGIQREENLEEIASLLCDIAQFNSEILEQSISRNAPVESFEFLNSYIEKLALTERNGQVFFDHEDAYRLDYLRRKYPAPPNIRHIMTEGHVEDFFGAWVGANEIEGGFNPDANRRIIFDVP